MVTYKTRMYYEKDNETIGAEVKLYSDTGENIDNILITSESKFRELADKILDIDDTYIDKAELVSILVNAQSELQINATKLDNYTPDDFARTVHSHDTYAQTDHASSLKTYGIGTSTNYGHNKIANNLTTTEYRDGEVLSAYQGKILNDLISSTKSEITKWEKITLSGHNSVADYCNLYVNKALRLARVTYNRTGVKKGVASTKDSKNKDTNPSPYWIVGVTTSSLIYLHTENAIPADYQPSTRVNQSFYRGDFVFSVLTNGGIGVHNITGKGSKDNGINIRQNVLYHY